MSNTGARLKPENVREIVYSSIMSTMQPLGPPFQGVVRYITFDNGTDADLYFGLTSAGSLIKAWRVRPGVAKVFDLKTNDILINLGDQVTIMYKTAPSKGDAFVETSLA